VVLFVGLTMAIPLPSLNSQMEDKMRGVRAKKIRKLAGLIARGVESTIRYNGKQMFHTGYRSIYQNLKKQYKLLKQKGGQNG